jgi:hypothetical protein
LRKSWDNKWRSEATKKVAVAGRDYSPYRWRTGEEVVFPNHRNCFLVSSGRRQINAEAARQELGTQMECDFFWRHHSREREREREKS